jgi:hypothetical protein
MITSVTNRNRIVNICVLQRCVANAEIHAFVWSAIFTNWTQMGFPWEQAGRSINRGLSRCFWTWKFIPISGIAQQLTAFFHFQRNVCFIIRNAILWRSPKFWDMMAYNIAGNYGDLGGTNFFHRQDRRVGESTFSLDEYLTNCTMSQSRS